MRLSGRKFSSATQHWARQHRAVLITLVVLNVAVFAAQVALEQISPGFVHAYLGVSHAGLRDAYSWQFITAAMLQSGPWHLLGNVIILYLLGRDLETILGQRHFLYLYLAGTFMGELGHLFFMPAASVLLAASGGVAAVVGAYAKILPELDLIVWPARIKAKHLAGALLLLAVILLCIDRSSEVSHSALLGGCVAGSIYAQLLGFGHSSFVQRFAQRRRDRVERYAQMSAEQLIAQEIDPLLEKISAGGYESLSRTERRNLLKARARILQLSAPN